MTELGIGGSFQSGNYIQFQKNVLHYYFGHFSPSIVFIFLEFILYISFTSLIV